MPTPRFEHVCVCIYIYIYIYLYICVRVRAQTHIKLWLIWATLPRAISTNRSNAEIIWILTCMCSIVPPVLWQHIEIYLIDSYQLLYIQKYSCQILGRLGLLVLMSCNRWCLQLIACCFLSFDVSKLILICWNPFFGIDICHIWDAWPMCCFRGKQIRQTQARAGIEPTTWRLASS